jgi:hypothetical protein
VLRFPSKKYYQENDRKLSGMLKKTQKKIQKSTKDKKRKKKLLRNFKKIQENIRKSKIQKKPKKTTIRNYSELVIFLRISVTMASFLTIILNISL